MALKEKYSDDTIRRTEMIMLAVEGMPKEVWQRISSEIDLAFQLKTRSWDRKLTLNREQLEYMAEDDIACAIEHFNPHKTKTPFERE